MNDLFKRERQTNRERQSAADRMSKNENSQAAVNIYRC